MTTVRADRLIVRTAALDALAALLAVAGAVLAVRGWELAAGVLLLVAVAVVAVRVGLDIAAQETRTVTLGFALTARGLVTAAVAVAVLHVDGGPSTSGALLVLVAVLLAGGSLAAEPLLRRAANIRVPLVAHLPGFAQAPAPRPLGAVLVSSSLTALMVGAVVVAADGPAGGWTVAAVLAFAAPVAIALNSRRALQRARAQRVGLPAAVAAYAPQFVVYTSRPDDASHQITMWLPYLQRAGVPFVIIARDRVPAAALAALTDAPVIEAPRISDLDALLVPSLHAAFYVNASSGNGAFVRYHHLTHVYLGHGDSDKPPSYNPTHAMYDQVFAAGPAATRRYAAHGVRIPAEKFAVVGRPQVEDVRPAERGVPLAEVADPVVLYAPTWRGHVEETLLYSLPTGVEIVSALLARGATVIFRPHPFSYAHPPDAAVIAEIQRRLADDAARTGRQHRYGVAAEKDLGIIDCINASDAMVSDVSSVVSDYLFSGKPFAMVAVPSDPPDFEREYPVAAAAYVIRRDLVDLEPALDAMLGADPLAGRRLAVRADYLGDFPARNYADAFVGAVARVAAGGGPTSGRAGEDPGESATADASDDSAGPAPDAVLNGEPDGDAEPDGGADPAGGTEAASAASAGAAARRGLFGRYWPVVRGTLMTLAATGVALLALVAAAAGPAWSAVVLGWAAIAVGVLAARPDLAVPNRRRRLLDRLGVARAALLMAAVVLLTDTGSALPGALIGAALAVALVAESHIARGWAQLGLEVHDFAAVGTPLRESLPRFAVVAGTTGALGLLLTLAAIGVGPAVVVGLAVLAVLWSALVLHALVRSVRRAGRVIDDEERLPAALQAYGPKFAVYFASPVGAAYQMGMWLPYFARIGRPFVIVTRTVPMLRAIAEVTAAQGIVVPIIYRPTLRSVEELVVPSLTTAFYVNNAVRNTHFIERRELTHVWLNHGDSEKPACYNPVHAIYDLLFAAGQAGIDRYARHGVDIPREKFRIVGRPQVEAIEPARGPIAERDPATVLYAPTWQGPFADSRVFSLPVGRRIVEALLARGVRVVFRAHPFNYRFAECRRWVEEIGRVLQADRAATGREHLWGPAAEQALTVEDCFNLSDAMISDISAVVSDYLQSDKPFAVVAVGRSPEQLVVDLPAAKAGYVIREDLANLPAALDDLLRLDPLAGARAATRRYYLGDFGDRDYADGFLQAARTVIDQRTG